MLFANQFASEYPLHFLTRVKGIVVLATLLVSLTGCGGRPQSKGHRDSVGDAAQSVPVDHSVTKEPATATIIPSPGGADVKPSVDQGGRDSSALPPMPPSETNGGGTSVGHIVSLPNPDTQPGGTGTTTLTMPPLRNYNVCQNGQTTGCVQVPFKLDSFYGKALSADGVWIVGSAQVADAAFDRAQYIVHQMLTNIPAIRVRMQAEHFRVAIIGSGQVLSDLPDYAQYKGKTTSDGRSYDTGTRGLGGDTLCSIGEENLLCAANQPYYLEDILVHEFAHSIKSHFDYTLASQSESAYQNARGQSLYHSTIYMMASSQEYWAEGTQSWFGVTQRTDVNDGYNTKAKLSAHDPGLAAVLSQVFSNTVIQPLSGNCPY